MLSSVLFIFSAVFIFTITAMDLIFGKVSNSIYFKKPLVKGKAGRRNKKNKSFEYMELKSAYYIKNTLFSGIIIFTCMYLFLRSLPFALLASMGGLFYPFIKYKNTLDKRINIMNMQLREAMHSISNSLKAGNSLQTAIENSIGDLKITLTSYKVKPILDEMELIIYDIQLGKSLDEALISFKNRVQLEDVDTFVTAAIITREKGGNLTEVMKNVASAITDKLEIKREILMLTASKRSEAKLLTFMPIAMVSILSVLAPSYMEPMYTTPLGKFLMLIGVSLICANYIVGQKIIDIDI